MDVMRSATKQIAGPIAAQRFAECKRYTEAARAFLSGGNARRGLAKKRSV